MKLKVDFEIIDVATGDITPANMTLDNPPVVPVVGDIIPTATRCFRVVQRAYMPERSRIDIGSMQLSIICTLMPIEEEATDAE